MKLSVFISWSGDRSKDIATALKDWLEEVFLDQVTAWLSSSDIDSGARWRNALSKQLDESSFGILCLTPENREAPWILFEAGAISKRAGEAKVIPYLYDLEQTNLTGPLAEFQAVTATLEGTRALIRSINSSKEEPIDDSKLEKQFVLHWPTLESILKRIPTDSEAKTAAERSTQDLLEEILTNLSMLLSRADRPSLPPARRWLGTGSAWYRPPTPSQEEGHGSLDHPQDVEGRSRQAQNTLSDERLRQLVEQAVAQVLAPPPRSQRERVGEASGCSRVGDPPRSQNEGAHFKVVE